MSVDLILPFLRPIAHLIQDPDVSEVGSGLRQCLSSLFVI